MTPADILREALDDARDRIFDEGTACEGCPHHRVERESMLCVPSLPQATETLRSCAVIDDGRPPTDCPALADAVADEGNRIERARIERRLRVRTREVDHDLAVTESPV